MKIKVLGTGCKECKYLEQVLANSLDELNITADIHKITAMNKIVEHEVEMVPALIINDQIKVSGRIPEKEEIKSWLMEEH